MVVYATDGLNKRAGLTILEDDRHFFPDYYGTILARNDVFERFREQAPDLEDTLSPVSYTHLDVYKRQGRVAADRADGRAVQRARPHDAPHLAAGDEILTAKAEQDHRVRHARHGGSARPG